jgi:hypothetical protein
MGATYITHNNIGNEDMDYGRRTSYKEDVLKNTSYWVGIKNILNYKRYVCTSPSHVTYHAYGAQGFPTPVTGLVVRQAGYWSGSLPPGRKMDRQAEKTDRHAEK